MGVGEQRTDGYSDNDYFRMGAAIAIGELYDMAAFGRFLEDEQGVRSYLESFGVCGMADVNEYQDVPATRFRKAPQPSGSLLKMSNRNVLVLIP